MDIYFATQFLYEFIERTTSKSLHSGTVEIYHRSKLIGKEFSPDMVFDFTNEPHLKTTFTRYIITKLEGISKYKPSLKTIMQQNCSLDICQLSNETSNTLIKPHSDFEKTLVLEESKMFLVNSYALNSVLTQKVS
jgi:hypothetical protein